ncbi:MAG: glycine cleavage T C-terminal barrel domain-containing protein [Acidobacteriota bacterium]
MLSSIQTAQYQDVRRGAALVDRHLRGRLLVRGRDRQTFLHALLTNDILALGPGSGCYAALLTPQGRMITDMWVFELGEATLLDVPGAVKDSLMGRLDGLIFGEDVQVGDASGALGCVGVHGPTAFAVVERALDAALGSAPAALVRGLASGAVFGSQRIDLDNDVGIVARLDQWGAPGLLIYAPPNRLPGIAASIAAAGAVVPDAEVVGTLRIESGTPLFLVDMTDDTIPLEAGIEAQAISSTKGCYPGQEVIVRIRDRGHGRIVRKLVGLTIDGDVEPTPGDAIQVEEKAVGHVTSTAFSPALARPIALGYVHRDHMAAGSAVSIARGDTNLAATVTALPFVAGS